MTGNITDAEITALAETAMTRAIAIFEAMWAGHLTDREHREDVDRVVAVHAAQVRALRAGAQ